MRTSPVTARFGRQESVSYSTEDSDKAVVSNDDETGSAPSGSWSSSSVSAMKFLSGRSAHPIEAVVENRSWMADDVTSRMGDRTDDDDDDEFRKELQRLNLSEEQVARDIRAAMELFQEATEKKELSERETSMIRMSYLDLIENGTRDSPDSTCPSDEACMGDDVAKVDSQGSPIETHQLVDYEQRQRDAALNANSTESSTGMHQETFEDPTAELLTVDDHASLKTAISQRTGVEPLTTQSLQEAGGSDHSQVDHVKKETQQDEISQWAGTAQLESGKAGQDIFEETTFWDDGLWKSPPAEHVLQKETRQLQNEEDESVRNENDGVGRDQFFDEYEPSNHTRTDPRSRKRRALETLLLPDLRAPMDDVASTAPNNDMPVSLQRQLSQESRSDEFSTFEDDPEPAYWVAHRESYELREAQFSRPTVRNVPVANTALQQSSFSRHFSSKANLVGKSKSQQRCHFWWTMTIVLVHAIFVLTGVILFSSYLMSRNSTSTSMYAIPPNDICSTAEFVLGSPANVVIGTTFGATKSSSVCSAEDLPGVWYSLVGTGEQIVASIESNNFAATNIRLLSGPCNQLACEGESIPENNTPSTTVLWPSVAGELYHMLVQSQLQGNFSLSFEEMPSENSECELAASIVLPTENEFFSVASRSLLVPTAHRCNATRVIRTNSWFSVAGNGKYITASLCGGDGVTSSNLQLSLSSGTCGTDGCTGEELWSLSQEPSKSVEWLSETHETYYLIISSSDIATIDFELCIKQDEAAKTCLSAVNVSSLPHINHRVDLSGTLDASEIDTFPANAPVYIGCDGNSKPRSLQWYQVEGNGETMTATTCDSESGDLRAVFDVFTGSDCGDLQCFQDGVSGSCDGSGSRQFLSWSTVKGEFYWIAVYSDDPDVSGSFSLDLSNVLVSEDEKIRRLRHRQQDIVPSNTIVFAIVGSVSALFAKYAWRWRRLKLDN